MIWTVFAGAFSSCSSSQPTPNRQHNQPFVPVTETVETAPVANENTSQSTDSLLANPLDHFADRQLLLPFGLYITPKTSPLPKPESFSGYHSGLDLEILAEEEKTDVPVYAMDNGKILAAGKVGGYGGVIVQSARIADQDATILYGHVAAGSFTVKVGDEVKKGQMICSLGAPYSADTGGNRKHLHLGIHKGLAIEYKGYVQSESDLGNWLNPADYLQ